VLVKALVARAEADLVGLAETRQPAGPAALQALAKAAHPDALHVVAVASAHKASNRTVAAEIERLADRLDVVVGNACMWIQTLAWIRDAPLPAPEQPRRSGVKRRLNSHWPSCASTSRYVFIRLLDRQCTLRQLHA
jgi:NAD(P)-dependent dehydrogenase (short-subunit alcohol dehydrogenase family)